MGEVVNLRRAKKQAARRTARVEADASAAKHGRTKAERKRDRALAEKAAKHLDGHKRDTE